jgi:hypothetical protein
VGREGGRKRGERGERVRGQRGSKKARAREHREQAAPLIVSQAHLPPPTKNSVPWELCLGLQIPALVQTTWHKNV